MRTNDLMGVTRPPGERKFDPRRFAKTVYKSLMILVTTVLFALTVLSYVEATPANGLLLVTGILGIVTLTAFVSIGKLDRQDERAEAYRGIVREMGNRIQVSTEFAAPDVRVMDGATVARVQQMAREGMSVDAICRAVEADYESWSAPRQHAYRNVIQALLDHRG